MNFASGTTIGHYRLVNSLGAGGMGVVYEAEDRRLGRRVAIKFILENANASAGGVERFWREARAASSLNHPGICTIYEIGEHEGNLFLAMELLEGMSLEKREPGPMPFPKLFDIGVQVAGALEAAHAKGIIHRDIKPANIFITRQGGVKLLDFGLAKVTVEEGAAEAKSDYMSNVANVSTMPGTAVGTLIYMSPQQARGEALDKRTDIFSLGVVLYELAAAKHPFEAKTSAVYFDKLLNHEPPNPSQFNPSLPAGFQDVLSKALEKEVELRYQTASEVSRDLQRLKRNADSALRTAAVFRSPEMAARISSFDMAVPSQVLSAPGPAQAGVGPQSSPSAPSAAKTASATSGSAFTQANALSNSISTVLAPTTTGQKAVRAGVALVALLVLGAASFGIYRLFSHPYQPFLDKQLTPLTSSGDVQFVSASRSGRVQAIVRRTNGLSSILIRLENDSAFHEIERPDKYDYQSLSFSPDSTSIYFVRKPERARQSGDLFKTSIFGGEPQLIAKHVTGGIGFSPDGKQIVYRGEKNTLMLNSAQGGSESLWATAKGQLLGEPSWSPDGTTIVLGYRNDKIIGGLTFFNVKDKTEKILSAPKDNYYLNPFWMPDGKHLLVRWFDLQNGFHTQVGIVDVPGFFSSEAFNHPVTNDLDIYQGLSVAAEGRTIFAVRRTSSSEASVFSTGKSPSSTNHFPLRQMAYELAWTYAGKLLLAQGTLLQVVDPQTGSTNQIHGDARTLVSAADACPDGTVVFGSLDIQSTSVSLLRSDETGGNVSTLAKLEGTTAVIPRCSPDGKTVYFWRREEGQNKIQSVPSQGGPVTTVTDAMLSDSEGFNYADFAVSPDGSQLILTTRAENNGGFALAIVDPSTGGVKAKHELDHRFDRGVWQVAPDSKSIIYAIRENGKWGLWQQPLDGSPGKLYREFDSDAYAVNIGTTASYFSSLAFSRDGKVCALQHPRNEQDAVRIDDKNLN